MNNKLFRALMYIVLGALFIVLKGELISVAMTAIAFYLIITGIIALSKRMTNTGVIYLVFGLIVLFFGWIFVSVAVYVIAALLLIYGILQLINVSKLRIKGYKKYIEPIFNIIICLCFLLNLGGTINWIFYVLGILFIIEGILTLLFSKR